MKIGLDWDGTVNADPKTFREIVCSFLDAGHEVAVVTWRSKPESTSGWERGSDLWPDMAEIFDDWGFKLPVYHCQGAAKRSIYAADIWIDDNPASVMFRLDAKPRFEANQDDYNGDVLVLDSKTNPIQVTWKDVKPRNDRLINPVNFEE